MISGIKDDITVWAKYGMFENVAFDVNGADLRRYTHVNDQYSITILSFKEC